LDVYGGTYNLKIEIRRCAQSGTVLGLTQSESKGWELEVMECEFRG